MPLDCPEKLIVPTCQEVAAASVTSPLTGDGTAGSPIDFDFSALTPEDATLLITAIAGVPGAMTSFTDAFVAAITSNSALRDQMLAALSPKLDSIDDITPALGDIIVGDGASDWQKLGVGANDEQLIADSSEPGGIKWGVPSLPTHGHAISDVTSLQSELNGKLAPADIGVTVQGYDADTLKSDTSATLTAGFGTTPHDYGTISSGTHTPSITNANFAYYTNNGAHTFAAPPDGSQFVYRITNGASAGAITTSAYTNVVGDAFTTVNGDVFVVRAEKIGATIRMDVEAL